jgi:hypothetical protein
MITRRCLSIVRLPREWWVGADVSIGEAGQPDETANPREAGRHNLVTRTYSRGDVIKTLLAAPLILTPHGLGQWCRGAAARKRATDARLVNESFDG